MYNPNDYEILLIPPPEGEQLYLLPETYLHIGEDGDLASQRTLYESAHIVGMIPASKMKSSLV